MTALGQAHGTPEPLWSIQQTGAYLAVPVATLYRWRHLGKGPAAYRLGRHLRYDPAEVRAWLVDRSAGDWPEA